MDIKVSLFASAVRPKLWPSLFESLKGTSIEYEIVFSGNVHKRLISPVIYCDGGNNMQYKYICTENIKPSQCYEIARRHCRGELTIWACDDAEFPNNVIGKAYDYWKLQNNEKLIISLQTKETGYQNPKGTLFDMNIHRFFGGVQQSPLMAPLGMMSRKFLDDLGGLDQRYICGQYENDIVMRAYAQGAKVEIFGGPDCFVDIDHLGKSILVSECTNDDDFRQRPFATGYPHDRSILEGSWVIRMPHNQFMISSKQLDKFQPYPKEISLTESHGPKGKWN